MFGSSSTTRTLAPSLFTMLMLIWIPVKLLRESWGSASILRACAPWRPAFVRPAGEPKNRPVAIDQPGRHAAFAEPRRCMLAHDDRRGRRDVGVDAVARRHGRRAPAAVHRKPGGGVDDVMKRGLAAEPPAHRDA